MVKFRIEKDSLGEIKVESTKLWGAQTQRSIENFQIGIGKFHFQNIFIEALALQKKSCAFANAELKLLPKNHSKIIDLNTAYTMNSENLFIKFLNIIIEPSLKFKRLFRS